MKTAREIAAKYVQHALGYGVEDRLMDEIIQYAERAIREDRRIIKAKKVPPHIVEYLPIPYLE